MQLDEVVDTYKKYVLKGGAQRAQKAKKACRGVMYISYGLLATMGAAKGINMLEGDPHTLFEYLDPEASIPKGVATLYDGATALWLATLGLQAEKEECIEGYIEKHFTRHLSFEEKKDIQELSDKWLRLEYLNDGAFIGGGFLALGPIGLILVGLFTFGYFLPIKKARYQARLEILTNKQPYRG